MYVNASLADPFKMPSPTGVASGGPQQDVLDIWKAAALAIDFEASDIYYRTSATRSPISTHTGGRTKRWRCRRSAMRPNMRASLGR